MNPVVHFEMPYGDVKRAATFYESVFGWKTEIFGGEGGGYLLVTTVESDVTPGAPAGAINGGMFPNKPGPAQHPSIVIAVEDIRAAMRKVNTSGGQTLFEPMEIPGVGLYVAFLDTEGNRNSMLQPAAM